jgi:hypothetical protein
VNDGAELAGFAILSPRPEAGRRLTDLDDQVARAQDQFDRV